MKAIFKIQKSINELTKCTNHKDVKKQSLKLVFSKKAGQDHKLFFVVQFSETKEKFGAFALVFLNCSFVFEMTPISNVINLKKNSKVGEMSAVARQML